MSIRLYLYSSVLAPESVAVTSERRRLRSLSLHLPQPDAIDARRAAGIDHHDEPEPGAKDRLEVRLDYETNLRSEAEIASLREKIDLLLAMAGDEAIALREMAHAAK